MKHIALEAAGRFVAGYSEEPSPGPYDAIVQVHRVGICGTDIHAFHGRQPFFEFPRILGHELGVEVVAVGSDAAGVRVGDRCSVEPYLNCGRCGACRRGKPNCCANLKVMGVHIDGGMRPRIQMPVEKLHVSERLSFDQLALVETLGIGAHAVERADLHPVDFVLVIGAGPIGLSALQFAAASGARVAVADVSEVRLQFCRERLNITNTVGSGANMADRLREIFDGELPNAVIDATGHPGSMASTFDLIAHGGRIVFVGLCQGDIGFNDPNFHRREITLMASRNALPATFGAIISAIERGVIDTTPWITHRLTLDEVPERFAEIVVDPTLIKGMISVTP
jgi:2-desacetyl-2-hydroxyethyl bacteriochlorophyllide A dehydrogenase